MSGHYQIYLRITARISASSSARVRKLDRIAARKAVVLGLMIGGRYQERPVSSIAASGTRFPIGCVKNALGKRDAVPEMKVGPSEPACRSRLQTAVSCCRPMAVVVNVTEKARDNASCVDWRGERKRTTDEASKEIQMASKPERPTSPGRAWWQPAYWPCGVRGTSGVTPIWALVRNLRTCVAIAREKAQAVDPQGRTYRCAQQGRTAPY